MNHASLTALQYDPSARPKSSAAVSLVGTRALDQGGQPVLAPLLLLLVGFLVWTLWAPAMAWVPGFAALLDRPVRKAGWLPFISGLETAGGEFEGRPVLLALHHKRGRNSLGYLVVAMQPRGASGHG